jgi:murein DD-endopeptidase MepM/ murein hydrolase activator NlpD
MIVPAIQGLGASEITAEECGGGRNFGQPTPSWWPKVRARLLRHIDKFPPGISIPFLGAWIEQETNGRHDLKSSLGEVGYFQIHPAEITSHIGGGRSVDSVSAEIQASPENSIVWGAKLLRYYDHELTRRGVPRRGSLYLGLLKAMHWSPWTKYWAEHVRHALGYWPTTWAEFMHAVGELKAGRLAWKPGLKLPYKGRIPSCSAYIVLGRMPVFYTSADIVRENKLLALFMPWVSPIVAGFQSIAQAATLSGSQLGSGLVPGINFGWPRFGRPAAGHLRVSSVWGDGRDHGQHEGIDIPLALGTPIFAVARGEVYHAGRSPDDGAGIWVGLRHQGDLRTRYMHLSGVNVERGQLVEQGQVIGWAGDTGIYHSKPHLHFSMKVPEGLLDSYRAMWGEPSTGFGRETSEGIGIPAEPLVPVDSYDSRAAARAMARGVRMRPTPIKQFAFAGLIGLGLVGMIYYLGDKKR